jgi:acid stress-induced BolA-like protein IbaG/YrbA
MRIPFHQELPLEIEAVAQLIRQGLPGAEVQVSGDGSHFDAIVVSEAFEGLTPIKKQRLVMDTVKPQIAERGASRAVDQDLDTRRSGPSRR